MKYQYRCDGMLTFECQGPIEQTTEKTQSSELTTLVAKDLFAVLNIKSQTALVFCGASFATEQLLQPKFPIQQNITQYASAAFQGELQADQILSIGASSKQMPTGLQPDIANQSLFHMPFCLYTNDPELAEQFEANLMHKGMVSPPTYAKLCALLQVTINHANYMSYLDLVAMMHNHYEQLGLTHVWQVIETALVNKTPKTAVSTHTHNYFFLVDHLLFSPYFSCSQFSSFFNTDSAEDYINWLMAQRISMAAFNTHGLQTKPFKVESWPFDETKICLGEFEKQSINFTFWTETKPLGNQQPQTVNFYHHEHAGIVAISVPDKNKHLEVHYPISPQGIRDIEHIVKQQFGTDYNQNHVNISNNPNWIP